MLENPKEGLPPRPRKLIPRICPWIIFYRLGLFLGLPRMTPPDLGASLQNTPEFCFVRLQQALFFFVVVNSQKRRKFVFSCPNNAIVELFRFSLYDEPMIICILCVDPMITCFFCGDPLIICVCL